MSAPVLLSQRVFPAILSLNNHFIEQSPDTSSLNDMADNLALCAARLSSIETDNRSLTVQWRTLDALSQLLRTPQAGSRIVSEDIIRRGVEVALRGAALLFQDHKNEAVLKSDVEKLRSLYDGEDILPAAFFQSYISLEAHVLGDGDAATVYELPLPQGGPELALKVYKPGHVNKLWCDLALAPLVHDMGLLSDGSYYVVLPRFGRALDDLIEGFQSLSESDLLQEIVKITKACVDDVDKRGVIHGDLRAPNIMRNGDGYVVIDYGNAVLRDGVSTIEVFHPAIHYNEETSREMLPGETPDEWRMRHRENTFPLDKGMDVFYLGVTLLEVCLNKEMTFDRLNRFQRNPNAIEFKKVPDCLKSILATATSAFRYDSLTRMHEVISNAVARAQNRMQVARMSESVAHAAI